MDRSIEELMRKAQEIASRHEKPDFYVQFNAEVAKSRHLYFSHPLIILLRETVEQRLAQCECLGHGLYHSSRVAWDCATLLEIELRHSGTNDDRRERTLILGLAAGILHDICRLEADHAERGAQEASKLLRSFPFTEQEISFICRAIRNHEAFIRPVPCLDPLGQLISDCLYDADKFRWGYDNFTHTLWCMIDHQKLTPHALIERFPWGIEGIKKIAGSFRTPTGKQFGPEIIECGIHLGKEIYRHLLRTYRPHA